jgi:hypothetical protein
MYSATEMHLQFTVSPNINGVEVGVREERNVYRYMKCAKILHGGIET